MGVTGPGDGPLQTRGADRSRLDMAFATARPPAMRRTRGGIPGLRSELFPAATWRSQLEQLAASLDDEHANRARREEARLAYLLSHPRAEDILHAARKQAQRLVGTAAAVAEARRRQAERAAAAALDKATRVAEAKISSAQREAEQMTAGRGAEMAHLNERLLRLRSALLEAETKLGAFSSHARRSSTIETKIIDLDEEQERGHLEELADDGITFVEVAENDVPDDGLPAAVAHRAVASPEALPGEDAPPAPRMRPKGRFTVPGLTPDRIEALRDELTP